MEIQPSISCDVLIVGTGLSGLSAALGFASRGFSVLCAGTDPPSGLNVANNSRGVVILGRNVSFLENLSVKLCDIPSSTPVTQLSLSSHKYDDKAPVPRRDWLFLPQDIGCKLFGYHISNTNLYRNLLEQATLDHRITKLSPVKVKTLYARTNGVSALLNTGEKINSHLVVGADGASSFIRTNAGIRSFGKRLNQGILVFCITHEHTHNNTAHEIYTSGGALTFIPLQDTHKSSVIWMDSKRSISSFQHLNIEHFTTLLQKKSGGVLGQIHLDTPIQLVKPSQPHCAKTFIAKRTALIGEAAHVFPPIGAQGLNTSLQDIAILLDCVDEAQKAGKDIGIDSSLQQYNQARRNEVFLKFTLLSTLNMMSMNDGFFGHFLRSLGMDILERATPIRKKIMQFGM